VGHVVRGEVLELVGLFGICMAGVELVRGEGKPREGRGDEGRCGGS
jgi:hypothetical protein